MVIRMKNRPYIMDVADNRTIRSRCNLDLWNGFRLGFAPHTTLFSTCDYAQQVVGFDSIEAAWQSVGDALDEALAEAPRCVQEAQEQGTEPLPPAHIAHERLRQSAG